MKKPIMTIKKIHPSYFHLKNNFNVQELASLFDGGGHKAASGFSSTLSEKEIIKKIKNAIKT